MSNITVILNDFLFEEFERDIRSSNENKLFFREFKIENSNIHGFTFTPDNVQIVITGVTALAPLISAFLFFLSKRKKGIIRIETSYGDIYEIPESTPPEKLREYLDVIDISTIRQIKIHK